MRILHTSDWHVGKKIGRFDRIDEHAAAIDEVVRIADEHDVDLVLHSGDVFDRPTPPTDALRIALDGLVRLTADGTRPVVAVAGNHDSGALFDILDTYTERFGVRLVGKIRSPREGGILELDTRAGPALVAGFPFLRQSQVVDFMARADQWYGEYADRVRRLCEAYAEGLAERAGPDAVRLLVAHFMVTGARVQGHGLPRGERSLEMGEAYTAAEGAIPSTLDYVAMGHIHAPQSVPHANVPAEYAGSLLELDFGEAGETKRVVVVDVEPGVPATIESIALTAGRRLKRLTGRWDELGETSDHDDDYLDLVVETDGPDPGLLDRARERFPYVVKVRADYEREAVDVTAASKRPLEESYAAYLSHETGLQADPALVDLFTQIEEEAVGASD